MEKWKQNVYHFQIEVESLQRFENDFLAWSLFPKTHQKTL